MSFFYFDLFWILIFSFSFCFPGIDNLCILDQSYYMLINFYNLFKRSVLGCVYFLFYAFYFAVYV
jgi:hypothetical protein